VLAKGGATIGPGGGGLHALPLHLFPILVFLVFRGATLGVSRHKMQSHIEFEQMGTMPANKIN